jgi:hypothetical protein
MLWERDPEVIELIRHFDDPDRFKDVPARHRWQLLKRKEIDVIRLELDHCQRDFRYASKNYFWITDKNDQDAPFFLWESQELILEKLEWLKSINKPQKLMILKARRLGCSTLIEGLIAWRTIFFPNTNALVVSKDQDHAEYLFNIMLLMYDMLPWWLQPELASRRMRDGLVFDRENAELRRESPGLKSQVMVQSAEQKGGVGQGIHLSACHVSEYADFDENKAKAIIDGDLPWALDTENPNTFGVLESTGKGAGSYAEALWNANVSLSGTITWPEWYPLFLPWFFEKRRFIAPEQGWHPEHKEEAIRRRITTEWLRCDNNKCGQFSESHIGIESKDGTECQYCHIGHFRPFILHDGQLRWLWQERKNREQRGEESVKKLREEICSTPQEAFQLSGVQVFSVACQEFVNETIKPPDIWGDVDSTGRVHYVKDYNTGQCSEYTTGCRADHRWDQEHPLQIWEMPQHGHSYCAGVDVAEGMGEKHDYSVIWVNRIGKGANPDVQVALWRSNTVGPVKFAEFVNIIGRMYNDALMCIEVNKYDTTFTEVRNRFQYPNMYRWKHYDSSNMLTNKWGWWTMYNTKPRLWQTARHWLEAKMWIVRSDIAAEEMKRFQKLDAEERGAAAETGSHDDALMSGMIALYCAHDLDYPEDMPYIPAPSMSGSTVQSAEWEMTCGKCKHTWEGRNPEEYRNSGCPKCGCIWYNGHRKIAQVQSIFTDAEFDAMGMAPVMGGPGGVAHSGEPEYDNL